MINERLVKAIILVTVLQSLVLVGMEIRFYFKERLYIRKIEQAHMFYFDEEDPMGELDSSKRKK